jgi:rare lipoprotein A
VTLLAARYAGRHARQKYHEARLGAWINVPAPVRPRKFSTRLMPVAAALVVAVFLISGASAAINLTPVSDSTSLPQYDPADIPPPDPHAGDSQADSPAARTPMVSGTTSVASTQAAVVSSGSCEVSYYADGQYTASGEAFDPSALTAASRTLAFGTLVKVTNPATGTSVTVRINDRGPYYGNRCLDLSAAAFAAIANPSTGVINAQYEVLGPAA